MTKLIQRSVICLIFGFALSACGTQTHKSSQGTTTNTSGPRATTTTESRGKYVPINSVDNYLYDTISVQMEVLSIDTGGINGDTYVYPVENPGNDPILFWQGFQAVFSVGSINFSPKTLLGQTLVFKGEVTPDGSGGDEMLDPTINGLATPTTLASSSIPVLSPSEAENYVGDDATVQMTAYSPQDLVAEDGGEWLDSVSNCEAGCTAFTVELTGADVIPDEQLNALGNEVVRVKGVISMSEGTPEMVNPVITVVSH